MVDLRCRGSMVVGGRRKEGTTLSMLVQSRGRPNQGYMSFPLRACMDISSGARVRGAAHVLLDFGMLLFLLATKSLPTLDGTFNPSDAHGLEA